MAKSFNIVNELFLDKNEATSFTGDFHSFLDESFLNRFIEKQFIGEMEKRNARGTHYPTNTHRKIDKYAFTLKTEVNYKNGDCLAVKYSIF